MNQRPGKLFFLMAALLLLVACGGDSQPPPNGDAIVGATVAATAHAVPTATALPTPVSATISAPSVPDGKIAPFTDEQLTDEQHQCVINALGESTLSELADRETTEQELADISHCGVDNIFRNDDSENRRAQNLTPNLEFTAISPTDIQAGLPPPSAETCPQAKVSLAEQTSLEWLERPMRSGDAAAIRFSPSNPDIVYLGVEVNMHSLYRSEDGGHSWNKLHLFDHAKDIAVHPENPDIVFLNESGYVWRTDTGERHLSDRLILESSPLAMVLESPYGFGPSETSWSSVVISPSDPDVVYIAMKGGGQDEPRRGEPEDASKAASAQDRLLNQLKADRTRAGQRQALFRSENGGVSFDQIDGELPAINVLFVHPSEPNTVLVGSTNGLYRSTDAGRSLAQVSNQLDVVDIDSVDGGLVLAATSSGIVRSEDGGINWDRSGAALVGHTVLRVQIAPSEPTVVWATTSEGIFRSNDSGRTWVQAFGDLPAKNLQALAVHPLNSETVLVSTETFNFSVRSEQLYAPGQYYRQGIYRTDNGGSTWVRSDSGIIEDKITILTAHPSRPHEVWAGNHASRGLYRSRDTGQNWSLSPSLLNHYPMQMAFFPDRPGAFVATGSHSGQNFGVTLDSGVNWFVLSEWAFLDAIRFDKNRFVQKDVRGDVHLHAVAVDPSNPLIVYAGSIHDPSPFLDKMLIGSHIFKSYDAGVTWEEIGENYPREIETSVRVIVVDPYDSDVIYLGTSKQESVVGNGLWISTDAGRTWGQSNEGLPPDASINAIVVHPSNAGWLLVGTEQGMYRSSNAARTWQRVGGWSVWDVELNLQRPEHVYAGTEEGLKFSPDFGETWKQVSPDQLSGPIIAITVNCNGTAVYVSDGEQGVKAAFAEPAASIPLDETMGVEYGRFTSTTNIDNTGAASGTADESGGGGP